MEKTEPPTSSASNNPKDSPETPMTLEHALKLLGLEEAPGGKDQEGFLVQSTARMAAEHGEEWIKRSRRRLVNELEYLATM